MADYFNISYDEIKDIELNNFKLSVQNAKYKLNQREKKTKVIKRTTKKVNKEPLKIKYYMENNEELNIIEAGVDEAGRGPMFGRVYTASVILPNYNQNPNFNFSLLKDSKRFSSKKKLLDVYNYIIENAIAYNIQYMESDDIDEINIRNATLQCMLQSILQLTIKPKFVLIDGCDFPREFYIYDREKKTYEQNKINLDFKTLCIEGGDNEYCSIAAASILAKVSRDKWIEEMCTLYPYLDTIFYMNSHKGYGTKKHIDAIKNNGITKWHRKSFGICKNSKLFIEDN